MDKESSEFLIGYGKPPSHTQFKPGQSGNPSGRPKKKASTFAEAFAMELNTRITVNEGGKARKMTKLHAIVKQQTNKALQGDPKATALVMEIVEPRQLDPGDTVSPMLQELRAIHRKHELADQNSTRTADASECSGNSESPGGGR